MLLKTNNDEKSQKSASKADVKHRSSKKSREIGKLVQYVALGEAVTLDGMIIQDNLRNQKHYTYLNLHAVSNESEVSCTIFKEQLPAQKLWDNPTISLNRVQKRASHLAFTRPFQLIQGPPG